LPLCRWSRGLAEAGREPRLGWRDCRPGPKGERESDLLADGQKGARVMEFCSSTI
jgi:hypothetical protein